jgi:hypothetical protein
MSFPGHRLRDLLEDVPVVDDLAADGNRLSKRLLEEAEGEGFEPSIRLTTDNAFRDRLEMAGLQVF